MKVVLRSVLITAVLTGLTSCQTLKNVDPSDALYYEEPKLATKTSAEKILAELPPAKRVITVSVYDFKDYTGQNKPGEIPQYSRAVTQGGVSILKKALLDAGDQRWFRVLERNGLQDLLQERKIIRSIRQQYTTPSGDKLPDLGPLLYSGLLLEGGIISYESNVLSGGLGARYLGIGASTQYRRDIVTVYLRAVSVTSGEILIAVNTSKTIFSTVISSGVFRYVSFDKILEAEAGYSVNEPPQLAVRQAIEMAVYAMILQGAKKDLWSFADPLAGEAALKEYSEKAGTPYTPKHSAPETAHMSAPGGQVIELNRRTSFASTDKRRETKSPPIEEPAKTMLASQKTAVITRAALRSPTPPKKPLRTRVASQSAQSTKRVAKSIPAGWYLQVAAVYLPGRDLEGSLYNVLRHHGYPVEIQRAIVESVEYYRILVGPYANKPSAVMKKRDIEHFTSQYGEPIVRRIQ